MAFMAVALLASCSDNDKDHSGDFGQIKVPDTRQLEQAVSADDTQASQGVTFTTEAAWTSTIAEKTRTEALAWITISPDHGDAAGSYTVKITLQPNNSKESRTAKIVIACGTSKIEITVTQEGSDENDGGDNPLPRQINGRLMQIKTFDDGEADGIITFSYDADGHIVRYKNDNADGSPFTNVEFTYTSHDKVHIVNTYSDKDGPQVFEFDCTGFFSPTSNRIESATEKWSSGANEYKYTYNDFGYLVSTSQTSTDTSGKIETRYTYKDAGMQKLLNLTQIDWHGNGSQTFGYDTAETTTDRANPQCLQLFNVKAPQYGINPVMLLIDEPDEVLGLGFVGSINRHMPTKVTTTWNSESRVQKIAYSYSIPNEWAVGEQIDGMTITVENYENGKLINTNRSVLTFEGI